MFGFFKKKKPAADEVDLSKIKPQPYDNEYRDDEPEEVVEPLTDKQKAYIDAHQSGNPISQLVADTIDDDAELPPPLSDNTDNDTQKKKPLEVNTPAQPAAAPVAVNSPATPEPAEPAKQSWAARLKQGLSKSRNHMSKSLAGVFGGGKIDEDLYEELETVLLTSDMGIEATEHLLADVRRRVSLRGLSNADELRGALKDSLYELLKPLEKPLTLPENHAPENKTPFVIMMAGVNGAGKTTSIGKLAKYFQTQGKSVLLAAGALCTAAARLRTGVLPGRARSR